MAVKILEDQQSKRKETVSLFIATTKTNLSHLQDFRYKKLILQNMTPQTRHLFIAVQSFKCTMPQHHKYNLIQSRITSADDIFRCTSLIYLSSSQGFREHLRGSTERNSQRLQMKYGGIGFSRVTTGSPERRR